MTEQVRRQLDALEILMQDHRELEALFRDFDHMRRNRIETGIVISTACAELKIHDTLETAVFYAAVDEVTDDEKIHDLLDGAEEEHDEILEAIEDIEQTRGEPKLREERFATLAERVKQHVLREENELFPLVRELKQLDLEALAAAMKKRNAELVGEVGSTEADAETA
jgi:iron-sulfur cluster repair protein YtfE (RIC family)